MRNTTDTINNIGNWPDKPAFTYGGKATVPLLALGWGLFLGPLLFISLGVLSLIARASPDLLPIWMTDAEGRFGNFLLLLGERSLGVVLIVIGSINLLIGTWLMQKRLMSMRPLAIDDRGIYAFFRGRPWRFLAWRDVESISKLRVLGAKTRQPTVIVEIKGPAWTLSILPNIRDFAEVCRLVTVYAHKNSIKLQSVDKGQETIRAQKRLVPREQYRQIQRTGLITEIAQL